MCFHKLGTFAYTVQEVLANATTEDKIIYLQAAKVCHG
jgi:hypothetical protein